MKPGWIYKRHKDTIDLIIDNKTFFKTIYKNDNGEIHTSVVLEYKLFKDELITPITTIFEL